MLPLKRPCSLSRPGTAISNPKFGEDIINIYISRIASDESCVSRLQLDLDILSIYVLIN